jgi:hypothetical protein
MKKLKNNIVSLLVTIIASLGMGVLFAYIIPESIEAPIQVFGFLITIFGTELLVIHYCCDMKPTY